jgi:hypothetical protein
MVQDGVVPPLAVGQSWRTGLQLLLTNAVEIEPSTSPGLRIVRRSLALDPRYEAVGRICPHPWDGWHVLDTGVVSFVAHDEGSRFPPDAMVRAVSPLLVDPYRWDCTIRRANPRGWRPWLVRQVIPAPAFAEPDAIYVALDAVDGE